MMFTADQIVQILGVGPPDDGVIEAEREKISKKYSELKRTRRWVSVEEMKATGNLWALRRHPEGADLLHDFTSASIKARAWWLTQNVLSKGFKLDEPEVPTRGQ